MKCIPSKDYLCLLLTQAMKSLKYSGVTIGTQLARQFATCQKKIMLIMMIVIIIMITIIKILNNDYNNNNIQ